MEPNGALLTQEGWRQAGSGPDVEVLELREGSSAIELRGGGVSGLADEPGDAVLHALDNEGLLGRLLERREGEQGGGENLQHLELARF